MFPEQRLAKRLSAALGGGTALALVPHDMTKHCARIVTLVTLVSIACAPLFAHGGQYRGPGSVAPPSNPPGSTGTSPGSTGSSSGTAKASSGPTASPASGPSTGPATTSNAGATTTGGGVRGVPLDDDLTRWEFWWEFGKDPYLRIREALYDPRMKLGVDDALLNPARARATRDVDRPTVADLDRVTDRLAATMQQSGDRDTLSACLVALAKIGRNGGAFDLRSTFLPFLARNDQELRETAAVALGISGLATRENVDTLVCLVADDLHGRALSGLAAVNERTRAFAAFGLGLLLQRTREAAIAHRIVDTLIAVLATYEAHGRDLEVAAISALSLFPADWQGAAAQSLRDGVIDALGVYYTRPLGPGEQLVQAQVPPAIGRLAKAGDARAQRWKSVFAEDLARELDRQASTAAGKVNPHIAQSCALALGALCEPWDDDTRGDAPLGRLLLRTFRDHHDHQTRSFALLALGRIGGSVAKDTLMREFETARSAVELPWVAMALGVLAARERQATAAAGRMPEVDAEVTALLRKGFVGARNPVALGALAIALGLARDRDAADLVRESLRDHAHRDDLAGYLCLSLGLIQDDFAIGEIRLVMDRSARRPQVLLQGARALGLLGDRTVIDDLCQRLADPEPSLVRLSAVAAALGQIGDRRSIDPLLRMTANAKLTPLTRAFAVVALGNLCDKDPLPWNSAYAAHTNYRAATGTLTDGAAGILDIL